MEAKWKEVSADEEMREVLELERRYRVQAFTSNPHCLTVLMFPTVLIIFCNTDNLDVSDTCCRSQKLAVSVRHIGSPTRPEQG